MTGTRVTAEDVDTGEVESEVIENDFIVICDGNRYLDSVQAYRNGTQVITVITIKRRTS